MAAGTYIFVGLDDAIRNAVPTFADLPPGATPYQIALVQADTSLYYFDPADNTWKSVSSVIGTIDINTGTTGTLDVDRGGTGATTFQADEIIAANAAGDAFESTGLTAQDIIDLQNDVGTLQTDVGNLQTAVSAIEDDIIDLQNDKVDKVAMTANALVRADGTGGDIKGSDAILDDSENLSGIKSITLTGTDSFLKLAGLSTAQRDALTPAAGMIIFNSDLQRYQGYFDAAWSSLHGWGN